MVGHIVPWGLLLLFWSVVINTAQAVEQTFYFTSIQYGSIDTKRNAPPFATENDYLSAMEENYGSVSYDPKVEPTVIYFEYY
ncbi:MAG: hypothetical protein P8O70_20645, partial [SAR324 cluster bacterium]|nr:hypothetical protein [SAR324 cluster bacterium]